MQCYRLCIRDFADKLFNCVPLFIDDSISELDFLTNDKTICHFESFVELNNITKRQLFSKCSNYCPKDCRTVDYSTVVKRSDSEMNNEFWYNLSESQRYYRKSLIWDSTQPMFAYNEESVMSFTDYLVNCGGLIGLWFGTNCKDFIIWLIETKFLIKIWNNINAICLWFGSNTKDFIIWLIGIQIHIIIMQFWIKLWHKTKEYLGLITAVVEISINQ